MFIIYFNFSMLLTCIQNLKDELEPISNSKTNYKKRRERKNNNCKYNN